MLRALLLLGLLLALPIGARAAEPHRSWSQLPSSNGWGAVVVDFDQARATHWRDHLFATEEPRWDEAGDEIWIDDQPQSVWTRDLLFDAYFGLRAGGTQQWLTSLPVDLDASGWDREVFSGTVVMEQTVGDLRLSTYTFAPRGLPRSSMVMLLRVENLGLTSVPDLTVFSVHNLHLGPERPGPAAEIGMQDETVVVHDSASGAVEERGFAGVTALQALLPPTVVSAWRPGAAHPNPYAVVDSGAGDLTSQDGDLGLGDDQVTYFQWDHPTPLGVAEVAWFGFVVAHHGDPFAYAELAAEVQDFRGTLTAYGVLAQERAQWSSFQDGVVVPPGLSNEEEALYRHAATVLRMAQVTETGSYVREHLSQDLEPRYSSFSDTLPAWVDHDGSGALLASLPPGQWTYAWPRDAAYAIVGMALAGMQDEARAALEFLLTARSGRYVGYDELAGVPVGDYQISLTRHHGFGIEESDTLGGGDFNFEFDGAGLTLWALGEYVRASGDSTLVQEHWEVLRDEVAGWLVALIDPGNDLIVADSGIWEVHWNGKQRQWTYTSATAARGLCEAADLADFMGEAALAEEWRDAGRRLQDGIARQLRDGDGAFGSNREEVAAGTGYADAAAIEAIALGLFDPSGLSAEAAFELFDDVLRTPDGPGYSRNDDLWDAHDLSPWGSAYDEAEWVFIDLRMAVALREAGRTAEADALLDWVRAQSLANYGAIGETYDRITGDYTNNAPMVGFGSGAWILAMNHRAGTWEIGNACGVYPDESLPGDDAPSDDDDTSPDDDDDTGDGDDDDDDATAADDDDGSRFGGCGCSSSIAAGGGGSGLALLLLITGRRRRRS
jgi:MYXO-CTERM domain-containing protein